MSNQNRLSVDRRAALIFVCAMVLAACGSVQVGRDFDIAAFETKVHRGETTQAQVRTWLGVPANTGVAVDARGERNREWTYYFGRGSLPGMTDAKLKMLQVRFDDQGKVLSYSWSGETAKTADQ
jgi:outer membrane protein assembly factor BamE (lipoprotein component of BamABCDE complex)